MDKKQKAPILQSGPELCYKYNNNNSSLHAPFEDCMPPPLNIICLYFHYTTNMADAFHSAKYFSTFTFSKYKIAHMLIQQREENGKGKFFVEAEGRELAEMTYTMPSPDKMIIDHTEVSDELRGKNIGGQLVSRAVEYAREKNMKILPLCTFAKSVFDRKSEFRDVLFNFEKNS